MLRGLLEKTLRESWVIIVIACAALGLVIGLFVQILPRFQEGLNEFVLRMPFFKTFLAGLLGIDLGDEGLTPKVLLAVVWNHPVVLSIVWGFAMVFCSRVPAGEIERGTIDVLLGWPVSRRAVFLSEALVCFAAGALMLACGLLGFLVSAQTLALEQRPELGPVLLSLANLYATYVVVGGATQGIAALCDRRNKAMGFALAFVLGSFLVNFLAQFWDPAARIVFASFPHYYRPAQVLLRDALPTRDVAVLLAAGAALWGLGCAIWTRRSVRTI